MYALLIKENLDALAMTYVLSPDNVGSRSNYSQIPRKAHLEVMWQWLHACEPDMIYAWISGSEMI